MNEKKKSGDPTPINKKLHIKKDTLRQLGPNTSPQHPMLTLAACTLGACTSTGQCSDTPASGTPCC
jgi:hypothetical protein